MIHVPRNEGDRLAGLAGGEHFVTGHVASTDGDARRAALNDRSRSRRKLISSGHLAAPLIVPDIKYVVNVFGKRDTFVAGKRRGDAHGCEPLPLREFINGADSH